MIERQIGQGGMAVVFEARHRSLGKRVALKMLLPHFAAGSEMAVRFAREGEAAARIDHPHAVTVTDVGRDASGTPFLVMELLEGEDLASLLERQGRLTVTEAADILVPVVSAIAAAHDLGIVHRDLKPQNIFLARRRHELVPKVVDFGISKSLEHSTRLTGTETLLGTPYYMSPEQSKRARDVDARSDQFSLGVILYECVTGQRPFDGGTLFAVLAQITHETPTPARTLVPWLEPAVDAIIERALQKDPADRYPNVRALGAALTELTSTRVRLSFGPEFGFTGEFEPLHSTARPIPLLSAPGSEAAAHARTRFMQEADDDNTWRMARSHVAVAQPRRRLPYTFWCSAALVAAGVAYVAATELTSDREAARTTGSEGAVPAEEARPSAPHTGERAAPLPDDTQEAEPRTHERPPAEEPRTARTAPPPIEVTPAPSARTAIAAEYDVDLTVSPTYAWIMLDGKAAGSGTLHRRLPRDGTEHTLVTGAPGHRAVALKFKDVPPPAQVALELRQTPPIRPQSPPPESPPIGSMAPSASEPAAPSAGEPTLTADEAAPSADEAAPSADERP